MQQKQKLKIGFWGNLSKYTPNEYTVYVGYDPKWENYPVSKMAYAKSQLKYRNYFYYLKNRLKPCNLLQQL